MIVWSPVLQSSLDDLVVTKFIQAFIPDIAQWYDKEIFFSMSSNMYDLFLFHQISLISFYIILPLRPIGKMTPSTFSELDFSLFSGWWKVNIEDSDKSRSWVTNFSLKAKDILSKKNICQWFFLQYWRPELGTYVVLT